VILKYIENNIIIQPKNNNRISHAHQSPHRSSLTQVKKRISPAQTYCNSIICYGNDSPRHVEECKWADSAGLCCPSLTLIRGSSSSLLLLLSSPLGTGSSVGSE